MAKSWKNIEDDREKYQAYLCSREWSVLKEAVHKRAKGRCERCRFFKIDAVHHLTYARKYKENLDDLQAICKHCHEFTHGKCSRDPVKDRAWLCYASECHRSGKIPVDMLIAESLEFNAAVAAIKHCQEQSDMFDSLSTQCTNYEVNGDDHAVPLDEAANTYSKIADLIQKHILQHGYTLWLEHDKPEPSQWAAWDEVDLDV